MKKMMILIVCCYSIFVSGQNVKQSDSYNYRRGIEAVHNNDMNEAIEYLNRELQDNPDNGYAYLWISVARNSLKEYGRALTAIDVAIEKLPLNDKECRSFAFTVRASIYIALNKKEKALADYTASIKESPNEIDSYAKRAELYYNMGKIDLADKDYKKIISLDQGNIIGYMGLGRNANAEKRFTDAIEQFNYVIQLADDYSSAYSFRAESYIGLKKYNEAIDDIITAIEIDWNDKAAFEMLIVADSALIPLVSKLEIQVAKTADNDGYWNYCLGYIYERDKQWCKAIEHYKKSFEKTTDPIATKRISICYSQLGTYDLALEQIDCAIKLDPKNYAYLLNKADILYELGRSKEAIIQLSEYINHYPEDFYGYYRRGFYKDNTNDIDGAIKDYSMAIILDPQYAYSYLGRGDMYNKKGEKILSDADYRKVIELDTIPYSNSCAQYAYFQLGEKEKAIDFMNKMIASDIENAGVYYDAASLYSRMGERKKAIEYLNKCLDKGYRRFSHINNDDDLDNIRHLPAFQMIIQQYTKRYNDDILTKERKEKFVEATIEIPFQKEGKLYKVKCIINDLPLYFVFDTGASDVLISTVEATFMLKNNYLSSKDIIGKQNYITANGEINEGTVINLRSVNLGGLDLDNVKATVVRNQNAPLLLGQSILNKLGKIEIDNGNNVLRITYEKTK